MSSSFSDILYIGPIGGNFPSFSLISRSWGPCLGSFSNPSEKAAQYFSYSGGSAGFSCFVSVGVSLQGAPVVVATTHSGTDG